MKNLKEILKQKEISQKQLSKLTGISEKQISDYANLKSTPRINTVKKIMTALDVSFEQLCTDGGDHGISGWIKKINQRVLRGGRK